MKALHEHFLEGLFMSGILSRLASGVICIAGFFASPLGGIAVASETPSQKIVFWKASERPPSIAISPNPTSVERFAAEELGKYLKAITGADITVTDSPNPEGKAIILGGHPENDALEWSKLDPDEFVIDVGAQTIRIAGGRLPTTFDAEGKEHPHERGTLYGVYDLLEKLGVRWYRPEPWGEYVPLLKDLVLEGGREKQSPAYRYRAGLNLYCYGPDGTAEEHEMVQLWATRNRLNTNMWTLPKYGGYYQQGFYHSYGYYVPQKQYFEKHPEYFALINGVRSSDINAQLCLSNPDVFNVVLEAIVKSAKSNPNIEVVSLDPNDLGLWCECDQCKAMDDPGSRDGYGVSMSNRVSKFNNRIAKALAEKAPHVKVGWLAYNRHCMAPSQVDAFEPNTMVQVAAFAGAYSDYSKELEDPTSQPNKQFLKIVKEYGKLTTLGTYEYWSDYTWPGPLPLIHVMSDRLKQYRKYNIQGIYSEMHPGWGPQGIGFYFFCRMLWNPDLDLRKELDTYYANFYGPAADLMKEYHETLESASEGGPYYGSGGSEIPTLFTEALLARLKTLINAARELVKGCEPYERRIEGVYAGFEFAERHHEVLKLKGAGKIVEAAESLKAIRDFFLSKRTGEVFENGPKLTQAQGGYYMVFADLEKELKSSVELFRNFDGAKLVQRHDKGWRFCTDVSDKGRTENWSKPGYDDSTWARIDATGWWQSQGFPDYQGVTWYRRKFEAPVVPNSKKMVLYFGAVDGDAEVYLNGRKVGEHLLGPEGKGYDSPFFFDLTKQIQHAGINTIAVRVKKDFAVGGINKGVLIYEVDRIIPVTEPRK